MVGPSRYPLYDNEIHIFQKLEDEILAEEAAHSTEFHGPQTENSHDMQNRFALILRAVGGESFTEDIYDCIEKFPSSLVNQFD